MQRSLSRAAVGATLILSIGAIDACSDDDDPVSPAIAGDWNVVRQELHRSTGRRAHAHARDRRCGDPRGTAGRCVRCCRARFARAWRRTLRRPGSSLPVSGPRDRVGAGTRRVGALGSGSPRTECPHDHGSRGHRRGDGAAGSVPLARCTSTTAAHVAASRGYAASAISPYRLRESLEQSCRIRQKRRIPVTGARSPGESVQFGIRCHARARFPSSCMLVHGAHAKSC
jgi:hypothetical protein